MRPPATLLIALLLCVPAAAQPGVLDPSFGDGGLVSTNVGATSYQSGADVVVQPDGRVIVAGSVHTELPTEGIEQRGVTAAFAVVRFLTDGSLDPSFGDGGSVFTPFDRGDADGLAVALQPDGRIVAVGTVESQEGFVLARYLSDGTLDPTFGDGGTVISEVGSGARSRELAIQADGRIIVVGSAARGSDRDFAIARYTEGGVLDQTFGTGGGVLVDAGGPQEEA